MTESQKSPDDQNTASTKNRRTWRTRRVVIPAVAAVAVLALGSSIWASMADDNLSGDQRDKASQAAVEAAGGGTVTEAEEDNGFYEVEVTRKDGTEVDVRLDKGYAVVGTETEGPHDDRDTDDKPLTPAENAAAGKAALAEVDGGTVTDIDRDEDGGASNYEVEVTKADGTEWSVRLDKDYTVLESHRDD